jgi:topoisomerase IA-like protein
MAKYGKKSQDKVEKAMHEMHEGTLKSGGSGKKVTNKKQAIAIGLSEARKEGGKVPKKAAKKSSSKKSSAKKPAAKKSSAKKTSKKSTKRSSKK